MIKIVICGILGKMGSTVARFVDEAPDLTLVGGVDLKPGEAFGVRVVATEEMALLLEEKKPDVVIDFTVASAAVRNVSTAAAHGAALVVGTTGFSHEQRAEMARAIEGRVPAVISSNFSIGVNIFWRLIREAARLLADYDIEVIEAHHRYKKDAPSGTAKTIIQILEEEVGERPKVYGRVGTMERENEIGVHVIRGGDIVGDHAVLFTGNFETIQVSHRAHDRSVFAKGALKATRWVVGKEPGIYSMDDVLSLRESTDK